MNFRANVWAFQHLGVHSVLGPCAAGSLQPEVAPGHFVVCDQLVDRTWGRPDTYFDGPEVEHITFADPYDEGLRGVLVSSARALDLPVHARGTVVVVQGARFSTRAESRWYARQGWDVVNMTQHPEAALCRELDLRYATVALVTDYDAGVDTDAGVAPVSSARCSSSSSRTSPGCASSCSPPSPRCPNRTDRGVACRWRFPAGLRPEECVMPELPPRPPLRAPHRWRRFRRQPVVYWLTAVGLAALTALTVARLVGGAREELDRYGPARATLVATVDVAAGARLAAHDVEVRSLPTALLPAGALGADDVVEGRVASATILAGEPFTDARLAPAGLSAVAALLPPGTRGLAVPAGMGAPPLQAGDLVDLLATVATDGGGPPTAPVAVGALVVHVADEAATVAVSTEEAPRVAYALSAGTVTLSLSATPWPPAG